MSARNRLVPHIRALLNFESPPSVVTWLEENLILPVSMSPRQPGPFRVAARPQMGPILECFHPASGVRDVTVSAGTQWAKTTIGCVATCYLLKNAPGPMLIAGPSEDWTKEEIAKKRLRALIDENATLRLEKPYNSDDFKLLHMSMIGMPIDLVGANSPTALAGSTRRYVIIEEASKIQHTEHEDAPEAHPIKNAMERTKDFSGIDLHYLSSTPNSPSHIFWQRYLSGSQTTFPLRCPHCGAWFPMEWIYDLNRDSLGGEFYKSTPGGYLSVTWDQDARSANGMWDENKVRETARFVCPANGCMITDEEKIPMLQKFEQTHANAQASTSNRSFRVPSFYSPRVTFGDMAVKFLDSGDLFTTGLQTFFNSWLALPWEEIDANIKNEDVRKLRDLSDYRRGTIPRQPFGLALCADVGDYKCEWEVAAIFENGEIAIIDWGTTLTIEDLNTLQAKLRYPVAGTTHTLACSQGLVDSRDQKLRVYEMCQRSRGFWWPADGADADHGHWGLTRLNQYGLDLFTFNTTAFKTALYKNAIKDQQAPRFYIPRDADEDLIHGHSGQQLVTIKGKKQWKKIAWDHFGDCSLRAVLAKLIFFWKNGRGAPDLAPPEPPAAGSFPES